MAGESIPLDVSIIIPARNEEREIEATLASIHRAVPEGISYEIIVADHGSTDRTVEYALSHGANIVSAAEVRLGQLRNVGANRARGDILVFLDADMTLTSEWGKRIPEVLRSVADGPSLVTGSWCEVDPEAHWSDVVWEMGQQKMGTVNALGGAHMIVSRTTFDTIGGFPPDADAGEDEIFCRDAWERGIPVVADPRLRVLHRGVAISLRQFFRRHRWHALGELRSGPGPVTISRTVMASLVFVLAHIALLAGALAWGTFPAAVAVVLGLGAILGLPAIRATRIIPHGGLKPYLQLIVLYYVYFLARASAWGLLLIGRRSESWRQSGA